MNRLLKSLLWTGVYLLLQPDRGVEPVRNPIAYQVARRLKGEDHTLLYVLTFAVGFGVGCGWGILTATATGQECGSAIAGRIRRASDRATSSIASEGDVAVAG